MGSLWCRTPGAGSGDDDRLTSPPPEPTDRRAGIHSDVGDLRSNRWSNWVVPGTAASYHLDIGPGRRRVGRGY